MRTSRVAKMLLTRVPGTGGEGAAFGLAIRDSWTVGSRPR